MLDDTIKNLIAAKRDFAKNYTGNSHIQEIIPSFISQKFPLDKRHLKALHKFAQKNPIYHNSFQQKISDVTCTVYEGDINEYWLNSIKHGTSCQPFYPTWIMSAYLMASIAKKLGYKELVDIGSGDGRIAFCASILNLTAHSIEIDDTLVEMQKTISKHTGQEFNPKCKDALEYDYSLLNLEHPIFFIGGLPQMGGDVLATNIIKNIGCLACHRDGIGIVFAGTHSKKQLSQDVTDGGWSTLIKEHNLKIVDTVLLPTVWTFDQSVETPYIYAELS